MLDTVHQRPPFLIDAKTCPSVGKVCLVPVSCSEICNKACKPKVIVAIISVESLGGLVIELHADQLARHPQMMLGLIRPPKLKGGREGGFDVLHGIVSMRFG